MQYDLSILIPARSEEFVSNTVADILKNKRGKTEILVGLDGEWADPEIADHQDVRIVYVSESIGQRAMTNKLAKLSQAKYVAKADAHTAYSEGFDVELMKTFEELGDDITVAPLMKNLQAFSWKCMKCGKKTYQGPTPTSCEDCDNTDNFTKKIIFKPRHRTPNSTSYRFDSDLHFQYANEFKSRSYQVNGTIKGYELSFDFTSIPSSIVDFLTDLADSHTFSSSRDSLRRGQNMTPNTMGLSAVDDSGSIGTSEVLSVGSKFKVQGVTTPPVLTQMVKDWNILASTLREFADKPGVGNSVSKLFLPEVGASTISAFIDSPTPVPAPSSTIGSDVIDKLNSILGGEFVYNEKTSSFHNKSVTLQPVYSKDLVESLSLQGSFFMLSRENYWRLNICDESWGSWGQQGSEVAIKTWLSGGRVIINKRCWYAHLFRTQPGFSFPYPQSGKGQQKARDICNDIFKNNKWPLQRYPLIWLIDRFAPIPGWDDKSITEAREQGKKFYANRGESDTI